MDNRAYRLLRKSQNKDALIIVKDIPGFLILNILIAFMALRQIVGYLYLSQILFLVGVGLWGLNNPKYFMKNQYLTIYGAFIIWSMLSILWAADSSMAISAFVASLQMVIICTLISCYITDLEKAERLLYLIAIASIFMLLYLLINTPSLDWTDVIYGSYSASSSEGRLGMTIGYHPNTFGDLCMISALIWVYFYFRNHAKSCLLLSGVFLFVMLFTKSRISLLALLLGLFIFTLLYKKRKGSLVFIITGMAISIMVVLWAVFNIEFLYHLIGFRLEGMLGIISSSYVLDASTNTRFEMIQYGLDIFKHQPITGVGIGNYAYYAFSNYGLFAATYAHNNYIELLTDLGLPGVIIYYVIPIWSCWKLGTLIPYMDGNKRLLCSFLFTMMIIRLMSDFGRVSYSIELIQIMNMLCYCAALIFIRIMKENNPNGAGI